MLREDSRLWDKNSSQVKHIFFTGYMVGERVKNTFPVRFLNFRNFMQFLEFFFGLDPDSHGYRIFRQIL